MLDDIAGMFRGIALWDGLRFSILLDNPQDPVASITNANVVDGLFTYSSMKRGERYNAVVVSWTDPNNGWSQVKEYVSDDELIDRYGYNETTIEAFGCTSRGQAFRTGKWLIETAKRETKKVTFKMAREGMRRSAKYGVTVSTSDFVAELAKRNWEMSHQSANEWIAQHVMTFRDVSPEEGHNKLWQRFYHYGEQVNGISITGGRLR